MLTLSSFDLVDYILMLSFLFSFIFSLKVIRAKVWTARKESPLFDVKTYTQNLEKLYLKMWETFLQHDEPQHIADWW